MFRKHLAWRAHSVVTVSTLAAIIRAGDCGSKEGMMVLYSRYFYLPRPPARWPLSHSHTQRGVEETEVTKPGGSVCRAWM